VALKNWFRNLSSSGKAEKENLSVDDLVTLERYDEALPQLQEQLRRRPSQHHTRLKLADLLMKIGQRADAVDEYLRVADGYAADGFWDKAHALVAKVSRLLPDDERLLAKAERLARAKRLDYRRGLVRESLKGSDHAFRIEQLWGNIVQAVLLEKLQDDQIKRLFPCLELIRWTENEKLVECGGQRDQLLWIVDGEVAALVPLASGGRTELRTFGVGDVIGDRALLSHEPWPATYAAKSRGGALVLTREGLAAALVGEPDPRGFLDLLRSYGQDDEVVAAVAKLRTES
jgi:hypothetical protein